MRFTKIAAAALPCLLAPVCGLAHALDYWEQRSPLASIESLYAVAYGNGQFVCGGEYGAILTSSDGVNWTTRRVGPQRGPRLLLRGLTYGSGIFVGVGYQGQIYTSPDGVNWTPQSSGVQLDLSSVTYGDGQFVAVGGSERTGVILTSNDGIQWTIRFQEAGARLRRVAFGANQYVAVGNLGKLLVSQDGVAWLTVELDTRDALRSITYGDGQFVALGTAGLVLTSRDGLEWTPQSVGSPSDLHDIAYGSGQFVIVGERGHKIWTSRDAVTWMGHDLEGVIYPFAIIYARDRFVAVGLFGAILTSEDGTRWTLHALNDVYEYRHVVFGGGKFVVGGGAYTQQAPGVDVLAPHIFRLLSSTDGIDWPIRYSSTNYGFNFGLGFGDGQFVALEPAGLTQTNLLTSGDAVAWTVRKANYAYISGRLAYGNGLFVGVADAFYVSPDGLTWQRYKSGSINGINAVTYGDGQFVAVNGAGEVFTSANGTNWTRRTIGSYWLTDVIFGNGQFVATGGLAGPSSIVVSKDASTWEPQVVPPGIDGEKHGLNSIAFGGGFFVAVGDNGHIVASADGKQWIARDSRTLHNLLAVSYGNEHFIAVGGRGTIVQSASLLSGSLESPNLDQTAFRFSLIGQTARIYRIQATTNLNTTTWLDIGEVSGRLDSAIFVDPSAQNHPQRFYRAVTP